MAVSEFNSITVGEFLDFAIELETEAVKKYVKFAELSTDENLKNILSNLSEVCAKHSRMVYKIKTVTKSEHTKTMNMMLPPPGYWEMFESDEPISSWRILYEASKTHLSIEENMLYNYSKLKQVLLNQDIKETLEELIDDETSHLKIMTEIVKNYERTHSTH